MKNKPSPKESMRILNSREKKEINARIRDQWGCEIDKDFVFLLSNKDKLYISDKDIALIDMDRLRVDNLGMYVATVDDKGVRLSIEGAQLLGPKAKKNIVTIPSHLVKDWFKGKDVDLASSEIGLGDSEGFVILKNKDDGDFLGCGKITGRGLLNFIPKARRIAEDA